MVEKRWGFWKRKQLLILKFYLELIVSWARSAAAVVVVASKAGPVVYVNKPVGKQPPETKHTHM